MAVVRLQYVNMCDKSTIKVRLKYTESKAYVRFKYGKSTVKYGKSTVLYGKFFGTYCIWRTSLNLTDSLETFLSLLVFALFKAIQFR